MADSYFRYTNSLLPEARVLKGPAVASGITIAIIIGMAIGTAIAVDFEVSTVHPVTLCSTPRLRFRTRTRFWFPAFAGISLFLFCTAGRAALRCFLTAG